MRIRSSTFACALLFCLCGSPRPVCAYDTAAPAAADTTAPKHAKGDRFFRPEPGFVRAEDLPEDFLAEVDTLRFAIKDAFEGSDAHTRLESWAFDLLDKLHIESRESTIRQRLLIAEGGAATKGNLLESEKALRQEPFLADAIIEVGPDRGGYRTLKVTTYDQWTTAVILGAGLVKGDLFTNLLLGRWGDLSREEWLYSLGVVESNLLGTGTRLGAAYRHDLERNTLEAMLDNQSFTRYNLQGSLYAASLSDGHSYHALLDMPLRSRESRYAFSTYLSSLKLSERIYFDANRLDELPDSLRQAKAGRAHILREYRGVTHDSLFLSATRSYGSNLKLNISPFFFYQDRYQQGGTESMDSALAAAAPLPPSAAGPWLRTDALLGASVSLLQYEDHSARNFHNLKWDETIVTGWWLTARAAVNQAWLGARNSDLWLAQEASWVQALHETWFASCSLSTSYFLSPQAGTFEDGRVDAAMEGQWKPVRITASVLSGSWVNLFATPQSRQILLGASEGLSGYPSFYYSGQARLLLAAEQRLFPEFEVLTLVPAYTAFVAAGNTYPSYSDFDLSRLHYSLGLGMRIGRSKSPSKTVQHISVSWPLGEKGMRGPAVSILTEKNL